MRLRLRLSPGPATRPGNVHPMRSRTSSRSRARPQGRIGFSNTRGRPDARSGPCISGTRARASARSARTRPRRRAVRPRGSNSNTRSTALRTMSWYGRMLAQNGECGTFPADGDVTPSRASCWAMSKMPRPPMNWAKIHFTTSEYAGCGDQSAQPLAVCCLGRAGVRPGVDQLVSVGRTSTDVTAFGRGDRGHGWAGIPAEADLEVAVCVAASTSASSACIRSG